MNLFTDLSHSVQEDHTWSFDDLELYLEDTNQPGKEFQPNNIDERVHHQRTSSINDLLPSPSEQMSLFPSTDTTGWFNSEEKESDPCIESLNIIEEKYKPNDESLSIFDEPEEEVINVEKQPKSQYQNRMKDHQGMIAAKIKKSCKRNKKTGEETRLFMVATQGFPEEEKEEFRKWACSYKKKYKTWKKLKEEFLMKNPKFGILFAHMAFLLLSEEFEKEYEAFINEGKMSKLNKDLLKEKGSKEFYRSKFDLAIDEMLGVPMDFENEIKKSRKTLQRVQAKLMRNP